MMAEDADYDGIAGIITAPELQVGSIAIPADLTFAGDLRPSAYCLGDMIKIMPDGAIERGPGFTTDDAAALAFWDAVERMMPLRRGEP